jgi:Ca2+-binding RTX toxin-like protein
LPTQFNKFDEEKEMVRERGTRRSDEWEGTSRGDTFLGLAGNDVCIARGGNDVVKGGAGNDSILGGRGDDRLIGGAGNDTIDGGAGNDLMTGNAGNDSMNGGVGNDTMRGGIGNDTMRGGDGIDIMNGGAGDDILIGDKGDDQMNGQRGNDRLIWNNGDNSDRMSGGDGTDVIEVNGAIDVGDEFTLNQNGTNAIFDRVNLIPFRLTVDTAEQFEVNGGGGDDSFTVNDLSATTLAQVSFSGGDGNDRLDGTNTSTVLVADGGVGNDTLIGGSAIDTLNGGDGNDTVIGRRGDDVMNGHAGNDRLIWNNGDNSDRMSGGDGTDVIEVNGADTAGDQFTLNQNGTNAIFDRVNLVPFRLTVDTAEQFEVNGGGGDDSFIVNDLSNTDVALVSFNGGEGNDLFDGSNTNVQLVIDGGAGSDTLIGGGGADRFNLSGNPFASGTPTAGATGIGVLDAPDTITNFNTAADQFGLDAQDLGIETLSFQRGVSSQITGNGNVIVLLDGFSSAGAAAQAIANNNNITADEGVFIYFNTSRGISRAVYSQDLSDGGDISVLANLTGQTTLGSHSNFSQNNLVLT